MESVPCMGRERRSRRADVHEVLRRKGDRRVPGRGLRVQEAHQERLLVSDAGIHGLGHEEICVLTARLHVRDVG